MKLSVEQTQELKRILSDESVPESEKIRARETLASAEVEQAAPVAPSKPLSTQAAPQGDKPKYKWVNGARVRVKE